MKEFGRGQRVEIKATGKRGKVIDVQKNRRYAPRITVQFEDKSVTDYTPWQAVKILRAY